MFLAEIGNMFASRLAAALLERGGELPGWGPLRERLEGVTVHPPTQEDLATLRRLAIRLDGADLHPELSAATRLMQQAFDRQNFTPSAINQPKPEMRIPRSQWWGLSDETYHGYHFWSPAPQGTVLGLGSFQVFNIVNATATHLVRVDYDSRQMALGHLVGGLLLIAETPEAFMEGGLRLWDPHFRQTLWKHIEAQETAGLFQPGARRLLETFMTRKDENNLLDLWYPYAKILKWMQGGRTDRLRGGYGPWEHMLIATQPFVLASLDWLCDPLQYSVVRSLHQRGAVRNILANLFSPEEVAALGAWMAAEGRSISQFYLSDPQDVPTLSHAPDLAAWLGNLLQHLPYSDAARLHWTSYHGELVDDGSERYTDSLSGYAYLEMSVVQLQGWLSSSGPEEIFTRSRLQPNILARGRWLADKISFAPSLLSSEQVVWDMLEGRERWRDTVATWFQGQGLPTALFWCRETERLLPPEKRPGFYEFLSVIEGSVGAALLESCGLMPVHYRVQGGIAPLDPDSFETRMRELQHRRKSFI